MTMENVMCVSYAGGQGKTTMAQALYTILKRNGLDYGLVSADFIDDSGHSKLGKLFPGVTDEYGIGAELTAARHSNNPNAPLRYWDKFGYILLKGGHIIDIGANVFPSLSTWSLDRSIYKILEKKNAPALDLFAVTKAEQHSVQNLKQLIKTITSEQILRLNRIVIVRNEAAGSFDGISFDDIQKEVDAEFVFLDVPRCYSEIWEELEKKMVPFDSILDKDEDEIVSLLDVDVFTAASGKSQIEEWLDELEKRLMDAQLLVLEEPQKDAAE
ncbi:MAG: hypothetical protein AAGA88_13215 [Pseudomonadota bacterium]